MNDNDFAFDGRTGLFLPERIATPATFSGELLEPRCWVCGCTEDAACVGGCAWVNAEDEPWLCSACTEDA